MDRQAELELRRARAESGQCCEFCVKWDKLHKIWYATGECVFSTSPSYIRGKTVKSFSLIRASKKAIWRSSCSLSKVWPVFVAINSCWR
jgi:hypothetical protein